MGIKPKELNPMVVEPPKDTVPQPLYWDKKKKKILDMIANPKKDRTIKEIALKLNITPWKVSRFIRDPEFQRRYTEVVEANTAQLLGENKRLIQELMRELRSEIKLKIKELDPNKLLKEYRLLLQGIAMPAKESGGSTKIQQNIISPQLISPKALEIIEKSILKSQGYKPLVVSQKEIDQVKNGKE